MSELKDKLPTLESLKLVNDTLSVKIEKNTQNISQLTEEIKNLDGGGSGGGISETARALLISILRNAVYSSDQSASITALNKELANSSSGDNSGGDSSGDSTGGDSDITAYIIVNNLENVETSNTAASVNAGSTYVATLTPVGEYSLSGVTVTMGGVDITATAWDEPTGTVTIAAVTGDIIITATADIVQKETLKWVTSTSYPNVTTFAYTEKTGYSMYSIAKQGTIQGGVARVDFDNTVYGSFNINFYVFDSDGNPYCQTDGGSSAGNTAYNNFSGDMGEIDWEDVGAGAGFGIATASFSINIPAGCTFIACIRRYSGNTVYPDGDSNAAFSKWAQTGGVTITVTG